MSIKKMQFRPKMQGMRRFLTLFMVILLTGLVVDAPAQKKMSRKEQQAETERIEREKAAEAEREKARIERERKEESGRKWTGNGGKGMSLTILAPQSNGLAANQSHLPALVQGEFVSNFSGFSAISILDWERRDAVLVQLLSGSYSDDVSAKAAQEIGNAIPTTHFMQGNITKTETGYNLQVNITKTADKTTAASYSGTFTFAELDNLTGIRKTSLDLLQKMGVTLKEKAQQELVGAAADRYVDAQTALARGVTAQRQGTEVAALSYYFQAAAFDPSLAEAVKRSSILNANITSGNIGDNVRNDIQWRKEWVERLTETERFFDNFNKTESMPYTLFYSDDIKQGNINYQTETVTLSIETLLQGTDIWKQSTERALQAVYDGLNATKRQDTWGLGKWPQQTVTIPNPFTKQSNNFSVVFELVNKQNKVIGKQTLQASGSWEWNLRSRPGINASTTGNINMIFQNVNANDISDNLTIRIASVNGVDAASAARNGVLQIRTFPSITDPRDGQKYRTVRIGNREWMAENLNFKTGSSWCYEDAESNCTKYGRLYDYWGTATSACPAGWRLPTSEDWNDLVRVAGGNVAGTKLKAGSPNWDGTGESGFSALPGGSRSKYGTFNHAGGGGYWWSAWSATDGGSYYWTMYSGDSRVKKDSYGVIGSAFSARCLR